MHASLLTKGPHHAQNRLITITYVATVRTTIGVTDVGSIMPAIMTRDFLLAQSRVLKALTMLDSIEPCNYVATTTVTVLVMTYPFMTCPGVARSQSPSCRC
jgi:hypothetical protein